MTLENLSTTNVDKLRQRMGLGSWAARLVYNDRFGGVIIRQQPGEVTRLHFHPDTAIVEVAEKLSFKTPLYVQCLCPVTKSL